ncbi:hypothetical protein EYF80_013217 [Liparis tanakae]|uniref:Uncharacterized protein n=1 Tax=Liparis tanakae TaxID=230148 RepID=A0A4Z2IFF3_9TELE|nr:hypothetical protein EYF80_013217 [Liparis tanakae]
MQLGYSAIMFESKVYLHHSSSGGKFLSSLLQRVPTMAAVTSDPAHPNNGQESMCRRNTPPDNPIPHVSLANPISSPENKPSPPLRHPLPPPASGRT